MQNILIVFIVLLVVLVIISTLGGSLYTKENFDQNRVRELFWAEDGIVPSKKPSFMETFAAKKPAGPKANTIAVPISKGNKAPTGPRNFPPINRVLKTNEKFAQKPANKTLVPKANPKPVQVFPAPTASRSPVPTKLREKFTPVQHVQQPAHPQPAPAPPAPVAPIAPHPVSHSPIPSPVLSHQTLPGHHIEPFDGDQWATA